jgi:hypothetical protein
MPARAWSQLGLPECVRSAKSRRRHLEDGSAARFMSPWTDHDWPTAAAWRARIVPMLFTRGVHAD